MTLLERLRNMEGIFIFLIFILIFAGVLLYFWYMNRASVVLAEKLFPVITIGLLGSLFTLWFSLKEEKVVTEFPAYIFYNTNSRDVLEKHDKKYSEFYGCERFQIRRYIDYFEKPELDDLQKSIYNYSFPENILFAEVLTLVFSSCGKVPIGLTDQLVGPTTSSPHLCLPKNTREERDLFYYKNNLPWEIIEIYEQLNKKGILNSFGLNVIAIPKGTKIKITCQPVDRKIEFWNDFCEVTIQINYYGGFRGLGEWQWILNYDDDLNNEYCTYKFGIITEARFKKMRAGHPDMQYYKNWVNAITKRLEDCLDSEQKQKKARDMNHLYKDNINAYIKKIR